MSKELDSISNRIRFEYSSHVADVQIARSVYLTLYGVDIGNMWKPAMHFRSIGRNVDLNNGYLFTVDSAYPAKTEGPEITKFIERLKQDTAYPSIKDQYLQRGAQEQEIDQILGVMLTHWWNLPVLPNALKRKELLLLRGELTAGASDLLTEAERPLYKTFDDEWIEVARGMSERNLALSYDYLRKLVGVEAVGLLAGSVGGVGAWSLRKSSEPKFRVTRRFFLGLVALSAMSTGATSYQGYELLIQLKAGLQVAEADSYDQSQQAIAQFDDSGDKLWVKSRIAGINVLRTLSFLSKTEEALRNKSLGIPEDSLAFIVEGAGHLFDRWALQEYADPPKRQRFMKDIFDRVVIPLIDQIMEQNPNQVKRSRAGVIEAIKHSFAKVDLVRIKAPDRDRFPASVIDKGITEVIASYESPFMLEALAA